MNFLDTESKRMMNASIALNMIQSTTHLMIANLLRALLKTSSTDLMLSIIRILVQQ